MTEDLEIGRILRSETTGFVFGCKLNQITNLGFGTMVQVMQENEDITYGLVYDIQIEDDGLVKQLITSDHLAEEALLDVRENRFVPVEVSVLALGYSQGGEIFHLLPPRPPLSLDQVYLCSNKEIVAFTSAGKRGYLRQILRDRNKPVEELLTAHIKQVKAIQDQIGNQDWYINAVDGVITLIKDDFPTLMGVLDVVDELEDRSSSQKVDNGRLG
jgi:hypothetical protein